MKPGTILGIALFVVGVAVVPFGWWLASIYFYGGLLLAAVGAGLAGASSFERQRKFDDDGCLPRLDDPRVPVVGELRGFKGREVFDRSHGSQDGSDAAD